MRFSHLKASFLAVIVVCLFGKNSSINLKNINFFPNDINYKQLIVIHTIEIDYQNMSDTLLSQNFSLLFDKFTIFVTSLLFVTKYTPKNTLIHNQNKALISNKELVC